MSVLLNQKLAAAYLGLSPRTLEGYRRRRIGPHYSRLTDSLYGRVVYDQNDLDEYLEQHKSPSAVQKISGGVK